MTTNRTLIKFAFKKQLNFKWKTKKIVLILINVKREKEKDLQYYIKKLYV